MSRFAPRRGHLVAFGIAMVLAGGCGDRLSGYPPSTDAFDAAVWKAHSDVEEHHNPRWGMVADVQSRLKAGVATRADVIALLGSPSHEYETTFQGARERILGYAIGWWGGFEMDENTLDISLDERGVYVRSHVHQH